MYHDKSPGTRLREAWQKNTIAIPGVFNAAVARMAEQMGFKSLYLSGAALSAGLGFPDVGLLSPHDFAEQARAITLASDLPLLCDADTGFGEAFNVERSVKMLEQAGVAGIHLEDQELPKRCGHLSGKQLVDVDTMRSKIRAAVRARRDPGFVIMARTDARGVTDLEDAIRRAKHYIEAGADAIFPEALQTEEEFAHFAKEVQAPLLANMTEFGKGPELTVPKLSAMGYRMVLYPVTTMRAALFAARRVMHAILQEGQQWEHKDTMLTRAELYELLGYQGFETRDREYFS